MIGVVRLVSYNILEGLRPVASLGIDGCLVDHDRAREVKAAVAELDPEILIVNSPPAFSRWRIHPSLGFSDNLHCTAFDLRTSTR